MFGNMRDKEKVEVDEARVDANYRRYKQAGKKNSLLKAVMRAFLGDVNMQFFGGILSALLNYLSPFIMLRLIKFIDDGVKGAEITWDSVRPGVILSAILISTQFLSQFI